MRYLILILIMLTTAIATNAEEVAYIWDYPDEQIDGFRVYVGAGDNLALDAIPPGDRRATVELGDGIGCQAAYITAYRGDQESHPSDLAVWCPKVVPVRGVIRFEVEMD